MKIPPEKIRKILCIKPRGIGDILLSTIIIDNLRNYFPYAEIDYLTEYFAKPSLDNNPFIHKVLTMGKKEFPLKVAWRLRKESYNLVLDLWSNPRSAQITFLSGVKYRVGFGYRGRRYAYNFRATSSRGSEHAAEHNLELLKAIGVPVISKKIKYYVSEADREISGEFFKNNFNQGEKVMGIIPAGGWKSKRCDKEIWVDIINSMKHNFNLDTLILWGPGDENDAAYIKKEIRDAVLAPATRLNVMAALIERCSIVIANDSGPMHISAALEIPTVGIFGPTNPKTHGPYSPSGAYVYKEDLDCIVCNLLECPFNHECMRELPLEKLLSISRSLLDKSTL